MILPFARKLARHRRPPTLEAPRKHSSAWSSLAARGPEPLGGRRQITTTNRPFVFHNRPLGAARARGSGRRVSVTREDGRRWPGANMGRRVAHCVTRWDHTLRAAWRRASSRRRARANLQPLDAPRLRVKSTRLGELDLTMRPPGRQAARLRLFKAGPKRKSLATPERLSCLKSFPPAGGPVATQWPAAAFADSTLGKRASGRSEARIELLASRGHLLWRALK